MKKPAMTVITLMALFTLLIASSQTALARGGQGHGMERGQQGDLAAHKSEQHHSYRYQKQVKQTLKRSSMASPGNQNFEQSRVRQQYRDPSRHIYLPVE